MKQRTSTTLQDNFCSSKDGMAVGQSSFAFLGVYTCSLRLYSYRMLQVSGHKPFKPLTSTFLSFLTFKSFQTSPVTSKQHYLK